MLWVILLEKKNYLCQKRDGIRCFDGTVLTSTSKHSTVRCCSFIGSRATGLYNRNVAGTGYTTCGLGGIFGLARHSVGGDVVVNAGTTI